MVGHTHEDVDAQFSQISSALRKKDCETLDDLLDLLPNSQTLTHIFNVKEWLNSHLNPLTKHTEPLHYKFKRVDNDIIITYKGKESQQWRSLGCSFFKTQTSDKMSLPEGQPALLQEDFNKVDTERLLGLIKNVATMFRSDRSQKWWETFVENKIKKSSSLEKRPEWLFTMLPRQHSRLSANPVDETVPGQIVSLIDKEIKEPQVLVFLFFTSMNIPALIIHLHRNNSNN